MSKTDKDRLNAPLISGISNLSNQNDLRLSLQTTGLLLMNLGTPQSLDIKDIRSYLSEFLNDPYVIDIPKPLRWMLVNLIILPLRPKKSREAYSQIWTPKGSPLMVIMKELEHQVQLRTKILDKPWKVLMAMRYGNPSIKSALEEFKKSQINRIIVMPLYPQYALSSTETALTEIKRVLSELHYSPELKTMRSFYVDENFIVPQARVIQEAINPQEYDHILFSFHGLPERHVKKTNLGSHMHCLAEASCCERIVEANRDCYRAQSFATAKALAERLNVSRSRYTVSFQSRLGRTPWIKPFTDEVLDELAAKGVKRLAVACPSFVTDCLETLEEIGMRAREQFLAAGGTELRLIPCLNTHPDWVNGIIRMAESLENSFRH